MKLNKKKRRNARIVGVVMMITGFVIVFLPAIMTNEMSGCAILTMALGLIAIICGIEYGHAAEKLYM